MDRKTNEISIFCLTCRAWQKNWAWKELVPKQSFQTRMLSLKVVKSRTCTTKGSVNSSCTRNEKREEHGFWWCQRVLTLCDPLMQGDRCKLDLVPGCMDPNSPNYDPFANVDDGSCPLESESDEEWHSTQVKYYANSEVTYWETTKTTNSLHHVWRGLM